MGIRKGKNFKYIHPDCCKIGGLVIFAQYEYDELECTSDIDEFKEHMPKWYIRNPEIDFEDGFNNPLIFTSIPNIVSCPWCGVKLPEFELDASMENTKFMLSEGYYCETCGDRDMECKCEHPILLWKIKNEM